jgi:CRISPR-associated endonuclease/helicase Cas3
MKKGDSPKPFIVIDVGNDHLPYSPEELEAARKWLESLGNGPLSQRDLAKSWEDFDSDRRPAFVPVAWLDGGPATQVLELREGAPGITVVLEQDADDVRQGKLHPARVAVPMPPPPKPWKDKWRRWRQVRGLPVAPVEVIDYDEQRGAIWRR